MAQTKAQLVDISTTGISAGSASAPGITFTGDTNTGIYSPGADQVAISTNGSGRLFVDSSGRVGVGTASPQETLHLSGSGWVRTQYGSTISATTYIGTTGIHGGSYGAIATGDLAVYANTSGQNVVLMADSASGTVRFASGGNTERMRIDSSGRVGIGTTSPGTKLEVYETAATGTGVVSSLRINANRATGGDGSEITWNLDFPGYSSLAGIAGVFTGGGNNGHLTFKTVGSGTYAERARIDSSGRLLVGTSSARSNFFSTTTVDAGVQFESTGSSNGAVIAATRVSNTATDVPAFLLARGRGSSVGSNTVVQNNDQLGFLTFQANDGSKFVEAARIMAEVDGAPGANDMPTRLVFSTTADGASSPTERMRIDNAGRLLVGTTDTSAVAGVAVVYRFATSSSSSWVQVIENSSVTPRGITIGYPSAAPNSTTNEFLYCFDSSAQRATIRANGGLANYQANNVNLSDINDKKDITSAADTWDCIKQWEIVNYRYKDQPDDADLNLGVIAQQVAESCPEVITVFEEAKDAKPAVLDEDGNEVEPAQEARPEKLGVKEQQMYWMAIKALQEAMSRIEQLEATNADLLARVTALEAA